MRRLYATALFKAMVEAGEDEHRAFETCSDLIRRSYDDKKDISQLAAEVVADQEVLKRANAYYAVGLEKIRRVRYAGYVTIAALVLIAGFFASFLPKQYVGWFFLAVILSAPIITYLIARRILGGDGL